MAKFDFNNSSYAKLWNSVEGRNLINLILNDPNLMHVQPQIWKKNFEVDPVQTPTAADGTASFTVSQRPLKRSSLMHAVAPLADTVTRGEAEAEKYSGTIGEFVSDGYLENAMERQYREDLSVQLGTDERVVEMFVMKVNEMVQSGHDTLDYLAAYALTHGYVTYAQGKGLKKSYYKAPIPASNFLTAGASAWTDPNCNLLSQMREKEKHMKEDVWGIDIPCKWQMPYNVFMNVFLKNQEVLDYVSARIKIDKGVNVENPALVYGDALPYLTNIDGVSPIEVVESKQYDNGAIVSGWAQNKVVFRPQGFAGKIVHTSILDEKLYGKYGSPVIERAFGWTADGLMLLENSVHPNGNLKEWHSQVKMAATPVLDDFLYHVILDIATAD